MKNTSQTICNKCNKKINLWTGKGYDLKGNLLCSDCWNSLSYDERNIVKNIRSEKELLLKKTHLEKEIRNAKKIRNTLEDSKGEKEESWIEHFYINKIKHETDMRKLQFRKISNIVGIAVFGFLSLWIIGIPFLLLFIYDYVIVDARIKELEKK